MVGPSEREPVATPSTWALAAVIELEALLQAELFAVLLTFARVGSALMVLPGFGEPYVMSRARLWIALTASVLLGLSQSAELPEMPDRIAPLVALVGTEVIIGLFIGATVRLVLLASHLAGGIMAMQSGLAAAAFFDPNSGTQGSGFGNFLTMLLILLIFVTDGHHMMLLGLDRSYSALPPGDLDAAGMAETFVLLSTEAIEVAVRIATPILFIGIASNLLMGVLNRLMPTFQVMFVVMPAQITLAFGVMMLSLGVSASLLLGLVETSLTWLEPR